MSRRMKLVLAYLGKPFHGWQRQRGQRTVQGEVEAALNGLTGGLEIAVVGAGRTDTGVHAAGQVAHCDVPGGFTAEALQHALDHSLPREIRVRSVRPADDRFHARAGALGKRYTYRARWRRSDLPWFDLRSAPVAEDLDLDLLARALALFPGTHDWASFTVTDPDVPTTDRSLYHVALRRRQRGFDVDFFGSGFLRYQVRRMMGAAIEVAAGQRDLDDLRGLIESPQPGARIRTAAAGGLCLEHVYYRKTSHVSPA
jgi:tRNA pseudouridine38-40 synthase